MPVVLATLCVAAYDNTLHVPFIFDDIQSITRNPAIRRLWPLSDVTASDLPMLSGRPLISLSLAVNYAFGGYNVVGYHLFNLLVHFLNAMLVFGIVRRTLTSTPSPDPNAQPDSVGRLCRGGSVDAASLGHRKCHVRAAAD